jgi:hypothetical protein
VLVAVGVLRAMLEGLTQMCACAACGDYQVHSHCTILHLVCAAAAICVRSFVGLVLGGGEVFIIG